MSRTEIGVPAFWALRDRYAAWSYKPGWTFDVSVRPSHDHLPGLWLTVAADGLPNSRGEEHGPASLRVTRDVSDVAMFMPARFVDLIVWEMIDELERHERLEWLRRDGEPVWPAHAPDGSLLTSPVSRPEDA